MVGEDTIMDVILAGMDTTVKGGFMRDMFTIRGPATGIIPVTIPTPRMATSHITIGHITIGHMDIGRARCSALISGLADIDIGDTDL